MARSASSSSTKSAQSGLREHLSAFALSLNLRYRIPTLSLLFEVVKETGVRDAHA